MKGKYFENNKNNKRFLIKIGGNAEMKINYGKTPKTELRKIKRTFNDKIDLYEEELEEATSRIKRKSIKRLIQNLMRRIERIDKYLKSKRMSRSPLYLAGKVSL